MKRLLVVLGPTGSGKSALAIRLALALGGEIVNFDSVQVHRGLDIGSAKTPVSERAGVPHHLIDTIDPGEELTAGSYARLARRTLDEIASRGRLPILAGGTGFYLRALLEGLPPMPLRNPELRDCLAAAERRRPGVLHRLLHRINPARAAAIHPNDRQKVIRAIECRGESGTESRSPGLPGFVPLKIGLQPERNLLYEQIDRRVRDMFERGLVEETAQLLAGGLSPAAKSIQSLGYKQALELLAGRSTREEAIAECRLRTRQYAKRQMTWFRRESGVRWLTGFGGDPDTQQAALDEISKKFDISANNGNPGTSN